MAIGFKRALWIVVAALIAHGVSDLSHNVLIANPGVPGRWPSFCVGFDVAAGLYLGLLMLRSDHRATA